MGFADTLLFVLLAAIWGGSYLLIRFLAPAFGPVSIAAARMLVAGLFLLAVLGLRGVKISWRRDGRHFAVVGLFNSAFPFLILSFAALRLPPFIPAVLNALTPLWGAILSAVFLKEALTPRKAAGLLLGVAGVALIALRGTGLAGAPDPLALGVCFLTPVCYAVAGIYLKRRAASIPSAAMTAASLGFGGAALLPFAVLAPPEWPLLTVPVLAAAVAFGLVFTAFAYLLYFRLMASAGVTPALSVTLVIPLFAALWGFVFLGETVSAPVYAGGALVLAGTALVIREGTKKTGPRPQP